MAALMPAGVVVGVAMRADRLLMTAVTRGDAEDRAGDEYRSPDAGAVPPEVTTLA